MEIVKYPNRKDWKSILKRPAIDFLSLEEIVKPILEDVKLNGDSAIRKYALQFDKVDLKSFEVSQEEINDSENKLNDELNLKKNELLKQKVSLAQKMDSARAVRKNWVEPLREWILDIKKATQLKTSDNFFEIRDYFKKIGTNSQLRDKSVSVSFCPLTEFARTQNAEFLLSPYSAPSARPDFSLTSSEVSLCDVIVSFAPTFFKH